MRYADTRHRLRRRLTGAPPGSLPGPAAQLRMAPATRPDPSTLSVEGKPCREAAGLLLLFPLDGTDADAEAGLLLTVRPPHLAHHAGQVALPGGRREPGEALVATALREAEEEVGLDRAHVDVLGALTPLYVPPSNFCVHPFVATADAAPALVPSDEEVAEILVLPLGILLDPAARAREERLIRGRPYTVPFYRLGAHEVWGATAMMLAELAAAVE